MTRRRKIILSVLVFVAALALTARLIVPWLIDIDRYRPEVVASIEARTGKPARIARLELDLFPSVAVRVDDFGLGNPSGFPSGDFISARRVYAQVDAGALWDRRVVIKSLELDDPVIRLLSDGRGKWNYQSPSEARSAQSDPAHEPSSPAAKSFSLGEISEVKISGGRLSVASLLPSGEPAPDSFAADGISSQLRHVVLSAFGSSGAPRRTAESSGGAGSTLAASVAYAETAEPSPVAEGTLKADSLRFGRVEVTGVKSGLRVFPKEVLFSDVRFGCYKGEGSGDLALDFGGAVARYSAKVKLSGVDVAELLAAFPGARGKMTGKMEADLVLSGEAVHSSDPLAGKAGTGHVTIRNGQLPSLQINKNLLLLAKQVHLGPASGDPSSFSSLSSDLEIYRSVITNNKIIMQGNGLDLEGSGNLSLEGDGSLNYHGTTRIAAAQNALTGILAGLSGATFDQGKLSFPFTLTGTLERPVFKLASGRGLEGVPQVGSALQPGQAGQNPADIARGIEELFKKRKK